MKDFLEDICGDEDPTWLKLNDYHHSLSLKLKNYIGKPYNSNIYSDVCKDITDFFNNAVITEWK